MNHATPPFGELTCLAPGLPFYKNFGLFFTTLSDLQAAQLLIKIGKSDKDVIKIILYQKK